MPIQHPLITLDDIRAAQAVIAGQVHRTPMLTSSYLSQLTGLDLAFKAELFQKTGSFKPRGALNKLFHLTAEEAARGAITLSAGNHGQALAWAATTAGIASLVVMPATAVRSKVEATRGYGGEVVLTAEGLMETCGALQAERGMTLVHPFDDPMIIAGAGTVGIEIAEDVPDVEAVIVGVGGGGLISGVATAIEALCPKARIIGVEPEGACAMSLSLARGEAVHLDAVHTVADGLAAPFAGEHTLAHVQARVDDLVIVSDDEILAAMRLILERLKVVAEPAAVATLAALLANKISLPAGTQTVCLLSGGNVDWDGIKTLL